MNSLQNTARGHFHWMRRVSNKSHQRSVDHRWSSLVLAGPRSDTDGICQRSDIWSICQSCPNMKEMQLQETTKVVDWLNHNNEMVRIERKGAKGLDRCPVHSLWIFVIWLFTVGRRVQADLWTMWNNKMTNRVFPDSEQQYLSDRGVHRRRKIPAGYIN